MTTTAQRLRNFPRTLDELTNHPDFRQFGSTSDDWIDDPQRMNRIRAAAEDGEDGSTHAERLQDMRDNLATMRQGATYRGDRTAGILDAMADAITAEIDACEAWHDANGSLHTSH